MGVGRVGWAGRTAAPAPRRAALWSIESTSSASSRLQHRHRRRAGELQRGARRTRGGEGRQESRGKAGRLQAHAGRASWLGLGLGLNPRQVPPPPRAPGRLGVGQPATHARRRTAYAHGAPARRRLILAHATRRRGRSSSQTRREKRRVGLVTATLEPTGRAGQAGQARSGWQALPWPCGGRIGARLPK